MRSLAVVEFQIPTDPGARLADAVVGPEIDFFVFDRAPEPLDEDVVTPGRLAVYADRDGVVEKQTGERGAGELAALIGIENLGPAVLGQRLLDRLKAELDLARFGRPCLSLIIQWENSGSSEFSHTYARTRERDVRVSPQYAHAREAQNPTPLSPLSVHSSAART
jgi:hypothetical protein